MRSLVVIFVFFVAVFAVSKEDVRNELSRLLEITTAATKESRNSLGRSAQAIQQLSTSVISVGTQQVNRILTRLYEELNHINNAAEAEHINATSCTAGKRALLSEMGDLSQLSLSACADRLSSQGLNAINKAMGNLNVIDNEVFALERRLEGCEPNSDICLNALLETIKLQELDIPRRLKEEVELAENKAEANRLTLSTCGVHASEQLLNQGSVVIGNIRACVDKLIPNVTVHDYIL